MRLFSHDAELISDPHLRRAFVRAELGRGKTSPNPMVGCVIVAADGAIVGEGHHERAGGPHAEVNALEAAGERATGATAYVTLEPCNHHGKTPPCTQALITAGISRVAIGMPDPNTEVSGGGADALREAGIDVSFAEDPAPFRSQNEAWLHWLETGRPWVRVKTALSLDGHSSASRDVRTYLTGKGARELTMRLRAATDAVIVGAHTATVDEPSLLVTAEDGTPLSDQPLRVILGRNSVPDAALLSDGLGAAAVMLLEEWAADAPEGADVITYSADAGLTGALNELGSRGITSVLVEAGAGLLTAFWQRALIDELVLYHAGGMIGGTAPGAYLGEALQGNQLDKRMVAHEAMVVGEDAVTVWRPAASV